MSSPSAKSVQQAASAAAEPTITLTVSELAAVIARATAAAVAGATHRGGQLPSIPSEPVEASPAPSSGTPEYLTTKQAAELLGLSVKGLEAMRAQGRGPKFIRIGHRIRYRRSDLER